MIRTRFVVAVISALMLVGASAVEAKTGRSAPRKMAQAGVTGSLKLVSAIFSVKRPPKTSLLDWAKASTEKARQERLIRQAPRPEDVPVMSEEEMMMSRDRD